MDISKILDWLKEDIKDVNEKVDHLNEEVNEKLDSMAADIKSLLNFQAKLIGVAIAVSAIVSVIGVYINYLAIKP